MKGWKGTEDGCFPPFLIIAFHMFEFFWKAFSCSESIEGGTINIIIIMHLVIKEYTEESEFFTQVALVEMFEIHLGYPVRYAPLWNAERGEQCSCYLCVQSQDGNGMLHFISLKMC